MCMCMFVVSQKRIKREPLTQKERRDLKKKRRKNYDIISRTLQLWEKLRRSVAHSLPAPHQIKSHAHTTDTT